MHFRYLKKQKTFPLQWEWHDENILKSDFWPPALDSLNEKAVKICGMWERAWAWACNQTLSCTPTGGALSKPVTHSASLNLHNKWMNIRSIQRAVLLLQNCYNSLDDNVIVGGHEWNAERSALLEAVLVRKIEQHIGLGHEILSRKIKNAKI